MTDAKLRIQQTVSIVERMLTVMRLDLPTEAKVLLAALHKLHRRVEEDIQWADELVERYGYGR